ncbi:MAG: hypothetical protein SFW36_07030 [Leptolyngbyaceae cyanobacterium bins.59]|nr:hypothetical protein [Leptolyngbyaceae cyanobacterium bins.59]
MVRKVNRPLLLLTLCGTMGIFVGGAAAWADSTTCLKAENPTSQCLTQNPTIKVIEGMGTGLLAGAGAAIGVVWQIKQDEIS